MGLPLRRHGLCLRPRGVLVTSCTRLCIFIPMNLPLCVDLSRKNSVVLSFFHVSWLEVEEGAVWLQAAEKNNLIRTILRDNVNKPTLRATCSGVFCWVQAAIRWLTPAWGLVLVSSFPSTSYRRDDRVADTWYGWKWSQDKENLGIRENVDREDKRKPWLADLLIPRCTPPDAAVICVGSFTFSCAQPWYSWQRF